MEDTRTLTLIQINGDGNSTILRTGEEFPDRLGEGGSPGSQSGPGDWINQSGTPQSPDATGPKDKSEMKIVASVVVTRNTSGFPGHIDAVPDNGYVSQSSSTFGDDLYSTVDKSKKKNRRSNENKESEGVQRKHSWSSKRSPRVHPKDGDGHENLAFQGEEQQTGNGNSQVPVPGVSEQEEPKQSQFAEAHENETVTYQTVSDYRATGLPIVSGIKKHNFEKGFTSNGVANGGIFPDHRNSSFSQNSSKIDTESQARERKKQEKRDRDPLLYLKFVCSYPRTAFG